MPGFDGTGPMGAGSMTGRAMGFCSSASVGRRRVPGGMFGFGRGMAYRRGAGLGYGPGRGVWGWGRPGAWFAYGSSGDEASELKRQEQVLQSSLEAIRSRLAELEKEE